MTHEIKVGTETGMNSYNENALLNITGKQILYLQVKIIISTVYTTYEGNC